MAEDKQRFRIEKPEQMEKSGESRGQQPPRDIQGGIDRSNPSIMADISGPPAPPRPRDQKDK